MSSPVLFEGGEDERRDVLVHVWSKVQVSARRGQPRVPHPCQGHGSQEYKDKEQGWKECDGFYRETGNVPEKGQRYLSRPVRPLGVDAIIGLYDPEPTWEVEDE